ncbi:MAG TPA: RHS repeat-associated core domain-containing protein [Streptosporangiaceae bacterium]|nr:RHS repeat-associated core domain-containing protein [Streptosporangiaceae bacterium]
MDYLYQRSRSPRRTFSTTTPGSAAHRLRPFGQVRARSGLATSLGYQGEYTDPASGRIDMHARWYTPATGTFTSRGTADLNPDPSIQANRYTYAGADPLNRTDPTGHVPCPGDGETGTGGGSWQLASTDYTTMCYPTNVARNPW